MKAEDLRRHNDSRIKAWLNKAYPERFEGSPDPEMPFDGTKPTSRVLLKAQALRNMENPDMLASDDWLLKAFFVRLKPYAWRFDACVQTVLDPNTSGGMIRLEAVEAVAKEGSPILKRRLKLANEEIRARRNNEAKDGYKNPEFKGVSTARIEARAAALRKAIDRRKILAGDVSRVARLALRMVLDWSVEDGVELMVGEDDRFNTLHESSMANWQERTGKKPADVYATYRLYKDGKARERPYTVKEAEHMAAAVHGCHTRTVKRAREMFDPEYGGEAA